MDITSVLTPFERGHVCAEVTDRSGGAIPLRRRLPPGQVDRAVREAEALGRIALRDRRLGGRALSRGSLYPAREDVRDLWRAYPADLREPAPLPAHLGVSQTS